jgi:molybdate transport repressor ModE-like protein
MPISASQRRLEVFNTIVEAGGFAAAAAALGISQPSVTAHVKALERQVGQPLFRRRPGRAALLTEAGETVRAYAVDTLKRMGEADETLSRLGQNAPPALTIAVHRDLTNAPFAEHIAGFFKHHGEVRLVVRSSTNDDVLSLLRASAVDLGIFVSLGPVDDLASEVLGAQTVAFVCAPHHPAAAVKHPTPRDLARFGLISGLSGSHYAAMVTMILRRLGVRRHTVAMEVQEAPAAIQLARQGVGIACQLESLVEAQIRSGELVRLLPDRKSVQIEVRWAGPHDRPPPGLALRLVEHLRRRRTFSQRMVS